MTKKETFKWIVQIIASVATAILTALGATSKGVLNRKSVLELFSRTLYCWWVEIIFYLRTGILLLCLRRLPPFTFSISSIVRARALISFCCFIILLIFNCLYCWLIMWFLNHSAKVRRFLEVGKYLLDFCPRLWRQGQGSATKCYWGGKSVSQDRSSRHGFTRL